jgi:hypothetical protein
MAALRLRYARIKSSPLYCLRLVRAFKKADARGNEQISRALSDCVSGAIRLSLPQAKVLNRRRQGLRLVALAVARDLCGILLKAVVVQYFAIGS